MLGVIPNGYLFLDTSVVLAEILKENASKISKLKNDVNAYKIPCFISDSVRDECKEKVEGTINAVGYIVKNTIKLSLEEARKRRGVQQDFPIDSYDVIELERVFSNLYSKMKGTYKFTTPIQIIEEWTISFLQTTLEKGKPVTVNQFILELVKSLLKVSSIIQDPYDELITFEKGFINVINSKLDQKIINELLLIGVHETDAKHIAAAFDYNLRSHKKIVFVTFDYGTIIRNRSKIKAKVGIVCCGPLYAVHYLIIT